MVTARLQISLANRMTLGKPYFRDEDPDMLRAMLPQSKKKRVNLSSFRRTFRVALKLGKSLIDAHRLAQLRRKMAGVETTVLSTLLSAG